MTRLLAVALCFLVACDNKTPVSSSAATSAARPTHPAPPTAPSVDELPTPPPTVSSAIASSSPRDDDSIASLVKRLNTQPLWNNGAFPTIDLAPTTPLSVLVDTVFQRVSFDAGKVTKHIITTTREVTIGADRYQAALVETDRGPKIVLVRHQPKIGWWSRVFEVTPPK